MIHLWNKHSSRAELPGAEQQIFNWLADQGKNTKLAKSVVKMYYPRKTKNSRNSRRRRLFMDHAHKNY